MELKWLEDLVALAESGSLTEAAQRRNITQPAFTRRIKVIERWLGTEVIDRNRKPARARPAITQRLESLKALAGDLRRLRQDVLDGEDTPARITIAAQHALTVGYLPGLLGRIQADFSNVAFRLRSANRDDCYSLLMTKQASFMLAYETDSLPLASDESLIEKLVLQSDWLVPVGSPGMLVERPSRFASGGSARGTLKIIGYPREVFFGAIQQEELLPPLLDRFNLLTVCETALVPGVIQLALSGMGIAWVPRRIAQSSIENGALADYSRTLGRRPLRIVGARLRTPASRLVDTFWTKLAATAS